MSATATGSKAILELPLKPTRARSSSRALRRTAAFHISASLLSLIWFSPIALVLLLSFRTFNDIAQNGIAAPPRTLSLSSYPEAWNEAGLGQALLNSLVVTVPVVVASLILASFAAYGLSRYRIPFARGILLVMLAGNLVPAQIMLVPLSSISQQLGIYDSLAAVVVVQISLGLGFYVFVLYGFMRSIPQDLQDAASLDGAGVVRIYWQIILPLCRPALAALGALAFTWVFNDLLISITLLVSRSKFPATASVLSLLGQYGGQWNLIAAATVIAAIPCLLVFLFFQRSFIGGLSLGAVK